MATETANMIQVGIVDGDAVEKKLMELAKKAGSIIWDMTVYATLGTVSLRKVRLANLRERMNLAASSDSATKLAFGIARYAAPRIAEALKSCATHDEAVRECRAQLVKLRGDLSIQAFYKSLRPESATRAPAAADPEPVVVFSVKSFLEFDLTTLPAEVLVQMQDKIQAAILAQASTVAPEAIAA